MICLVIVLIKPIQDMGGAGGGGGRGAGGREISPSILSLVASTKVGISHQNFSTYIFKTFATLALKLKAILIALTYAIYT